MRKNRDECECVEKGIPCLVLGGVVTSAEAGTAQIMAESQFSISLIRKRAAPIARQGDSCKKEQIGLLGHRSCMFANPRCMRLVVKLKTDVGLRVYKKR